MKKASAGLKFWGTQSAIFVELPNGLKFKLSSIYSGGKASFVRQIPYTAEQVEVDDAEIPGWIFSETVYVVGQKSWLITNAKNLNSAKAIAGREYGGSNQPFYVGLMDGTGTVSIQAVRVNNEWEIAS